MTWLWNRVVGMVRGFTVDDELKQIIEKQQEIISAQNRLLTKLQLVSEARFKLSLDLANAISDSYNVVRPQEFVAARAATAFKKYKKCTQE